MKIQNISDQPFSFEITQLAAGEIKEVPNEIGQRLLVLYWNKPLVLVDDKVAVNTGTPKIEVFTTTEEKNKEILEEIEKEEVKVPSMLKKVNSNK
jgi:hypothetical protein